MYRILIIEDDRTIANVLAEHLRTWDYEVHCVTNFKNVMEDFREYEPQLVLVTAKVQAVLRRAYAFRGTMDVLEHAGVMLNVNDATVTCGSQSVELTKNEFRILKLLMENSGRIVSRENLITRLWESDEFIDDNTLTVNVARLRKKLEEIGAENWIQTKKGIGYIVE